MSPQGQVPIEVCDNSKGIMDDVNKIHDLVSGHNDDGNIFLLRSLRGLALASIAEWNPEIADILVPTPLCKILFMLKKITGLYDIGILSLVYLTQYEK